MEFVNNTPIPAMLAVSSVDGLDHRIGTIIAKTTCTYDEWDRCKLDTQSPLPLFDMDIETDLGALPPDLLPMRSDLFEVILLGSAHAPAGTAVSEQRVTLSIGDHAQQLIVFGDRHWLPGGEISVPEPFTKMPLTWSRAFGGTSEVEIDREAVIEVSDPCNRRGRGFDPAPFVDSIRKLIRMPSGYPIYNTERLLPNLESPNNRIKNNTDAPAPVCWATVPNDCILDVSSVQSAAGNGEFDLKQAARIMLVRAHPNWVIPAPASGTPISLRGLDPIGERTIVYPNFNLVVDYVVDGRTGALPLVAHRLIILSDERRIVLVWRKVFQCGYDDSVERSFRLRCTEN